MKLSVVDIKGKKLSTMTVSDEVWKVPMNVALVAQAVNVYRSNQRQSPAKAKRRGEVRGSRRKLWRQKGTGRARHGDRFAPIFVGGGVAHGPTGRENYRKSMNKKMRRKALFMVLSDKLQHGQVTLVDKLPAGLRKTKELQAILSGIVEEKRILLVTEQPTVFETRAVRNLVETTLRAAYQLNALEILQCRHLVLTKDAVGRIEEHFLKP